MITRINPSRNSYDAENKQKYGYVIRVPKLPDAHAGVEGFTVFNLEDDCFYKCKHITQVGTSYYGWVRVTFGAAKSFLVPVNRLTLIDRESIAPLSTTVVVDAETLGKTLNEITVGMRRYNVNIAPLGYTATTDTVYTEGKTYYGWKWTNQDASITSFEYDGHKVFVGDFVELKAGTASEVGLGTADYVIGTDIPANTAYHPNASGWDSVTSTDFANTINALVGELNIHEANLPTVSASDTASRFCYVTNLIIDEVNPFSIPWQILVDRVLVVEQKIGPSTMGTTNVDEDGNPVTVDISKWDKATWNNYVAKEVGDTLYYGTVSEVTDSTLKLIQRLDTRIGPISSLTEIGDKTLAQWLNELYARVKALEEGTRRNLLGLKQLWDSLGKNVGFVAVTGSFDSNTTYYKFSTSAYYFQELTIGTKEEVEAKPPRADYYPEMPYSEFDPGTGWEGAYYFVSDGALIEEGGKITGMQGSAGAMINMINALLGYKLNTIKFESFDEVARPGVNYYKYYNNRYVQLELTGGEDLTALRKEVGPIFIDATGTTVVNQIYANNLEIGYINAREYGHYEEIKALITGLRTDLTMAQSDIDRLRQLTGVASGETSAHGTTLNDDGTVATVNWTVDGYETCTSSTYSEDRDYFYYGTEMARSGTKWPCGDNPVYSASLPGFTIVYYTFDYTTCVWTEVEPETYVDDEGVTRCKRNDLWYTASTGRGATATHWVQLEPGTLEECEKGYANYVVPYYFITADANYVADKDYYCYKAAKFTYVKLTVDVDYSVGDKITYNGVYNSKIYEYANPTPMGTIYPPHGWTWRVPVEKVEGANVCVRRTQYKDLNTHRGLIDRNTVAINDQRDRCSLAQKKTNLRLDNLEQYIMEMLLVTIDLITQEVSTLSLIHERLDKLISLHNAMERLSGEQSYKLADYKYESGFEYYLKKGDNYYLMIEGSDDEELTYEIGHDVKENVYTKDLVIAQTENYTLDDLRIALNRILRLHLETGELPEYTALPTDTIILESMTYWRWDGEKWEDIVPERDDPYMIGKEIGAYDPEHTWYIRFAEITPDDINTYSETPVRIYFNELVKLHRKSS